MLLPTRPDTFAPRATVVCCAVLFQGELLLLKRAKGQWYEGLFGYPAGKPKPIDGGNLRATAVRELVEETGIAAFEFELREHGDGELYSRLTDANGTADYIVHLFSYSVQRKPQAIKWDPANHECYEWFPFSMVRARIDECIDDVADCLDLILSDPREHTVLAITA